MFAKVLGIIDQDAEAVYDNSFIKLVRGYRNRK